MEENKEILNVKKINETVTLTKKILNLLYVVFLICGIYVITIVFKEWNTFTFIFQMLSILSPLFIGLLIAWLFNPIIKWLQDKGLKRKFGAVLIYSIFLGILALIVGTIIPLLSSEISSLATTLPETFEVVTDFSKSVVENFANTFNLDTIEIENQLFSELENYGSDITESLPSLIITTGSALLSGFAMILVGLVIGFFLLISFEDFSFIINFLPKKIQKDTEHLLKNIDNSLRKYVQGAIIDSTLIFVVSSLAFSLIGLKSPLLFGLFCGITNIIPYVGPYIGGFPAAVVGFSQGTTIGILVILAVGIIQFLEGNFLQPLILAKTTKLHPVTIIIGLLVFGYFWGILGMIVATPIIAVMKSILMFFEAKYDWFSFDDEI